MVENSIERDLLQHKKAAERLFCAATLIQADMIRHDTGWLKPEWFSHLGYREFWERVLSGQNPAQVSIDLELYSDLLKAQGDLISSMEYPAFAETIMSDHYLLATAGVLPKLASAIAARDFEQIQETITALSEKRVSRESTVKTAVDIGMEFSEILGRDDIAIKTGITTLDQAMGGYTKKALHLIAARTSVGKSTMAFQMSRNLAVQKHRVLYFSVEMAATSLWAKAACGVSGVGWKKVKSNELTAEEHTKLVDTTGHLMDIYGEYLMIDDRSRLTSDDIWRTVAEVKPDVIVVDHLSLLADKARNEVDRIGQITWTGKQIAKEFDLIAIYVQQLSRSLTQREDRHPVMTDLRDSGHSEENADTILFLHREDYYATAGVNSVEWSPTQLIIAKDREGTRNIEARVVYNTKQQWFYPTAVAKLKGYSG